MFPLIISLLLGSRPTTQVYISSRSTKACEETAAELNTIGPGSCIPLPADLQKLSEVEKLVKQLSDKEATLHVLVNNAGANWGEGINEYPVSAMSFDMENCHTHESDSCSLHAGCGFRKGFDAQPTKGIHPHPKMPSTSPCSCHRRRCERTSV